MSTYGAISGLLINNHYMDIISNNIANASTIGYKSSKPLFFDMFSHTLYSNSTNGYGVGISNVIQNFHNGMLVETGRDLDLGIVQDGFFRVLDSQSHIHYTRDGQFLLDKNKNIINMQGMYLTGQNLSCSKNNSNNISNLEPINLKHADFLKERPTSKITLKIILNRDTDIISNKDYDQNDLSKFEDYSTYINIYNKQGHLEKINFSFKKIATNKWKVDATSNDTSKKTDKENINKSFELEFDSDGKLTSDSSINIQANNSKYENITLNLTGTSEQSNTDNSLENFSQDGYEKGFLKTFNVFPNGEIIATYSNEQTQSIGQILLSKFINPEKLQPESGNVWSATAESGPETIGIAGDSGFGVLADKSLEASNVDLNKELINMIIAQRNYQSNAQSFKAEDKIINTLLNLQ